MSLRSSLARGAHRSLRTSPVDLLLVVVVPLGVASAVQRVPESLLERGIAAVVAVGILGLVLRQPERAIVWLIGFLPLQLTVFSLAYRFGVPGAVLRPLGSYRDIVVVGVAIA